MPLSRTATCTSAASGRAPLNQRMARKPHWRLTNGSASAGAFAAFFFALSHRLGTGSTSSMASEARSFLRSAGVSFLSLQIDDLKTPQGFAGCLRGRYRECAPCSSQRHRAVLWQGCLLSADKQGTEPACMPTSLRSVSRGPATASGMDAANFLLEADLATGVLARCSTAPGLKRTMSWPVTRSSGSRFAGLGVYGSRHGQNPFFTSGCRHKSK